MKSILLASASIVAFAGAAAAEVTFSGSAELGYNDTDSRNFGATPDDDDDTGSDAGFFWSANVAVTMSQALDNGLTAAATFNFDVADDSTGLGLESGGYVLSLTSESAGLYFGETAFAAQTYWSGVSGMENDGFSEADGETVIRAEVTYGGVTGGVSYIVDTNGSFDPDLRDDIPPNDEREYTGTGDLVQLSVGATAEVGNFTVGMAYQEGIDAAYLVPQIQADGTVANVFNDNGDISNDEIFGLFAKTTFGGADLHLAYASNQTAGEDSIGIAAKYPVGPVTLGAYYVMQDNGDGNAYGISADYASGPITVGVNYEDTDNGEEDWSVEGSYDVGNGIMVYAGVADAGEDYYAAGTIAMGEGASLLVSYAEDGDGDADDDIGTNEYKAGATVAVTFEF